MAKKRLWDAIMRYGTGRQYLMIYFLSGVVWLLHTRVTRQSVCFDHDQSFDNTHPKRGLPPIRPRTSFDPSRGFDSTNETITSDGTIRLHRQYYKLDESIPIVFVITPTFRRPLQMVDMVRLSQTLQLDKAIYWLVVEDQERPSARIRALLERTGLPFAHLAVHQEQTSEGKKPNGKGIYQRNRAIETVESLNTPGVVYFGDDDNAYDARLFSQMRQVQRVGVSGVGFAVDWYELCVVDNETNKVKELYSNWKSGRKFEIDMAAFGIHTDVLQEKHPRFRDDWPISYLETRFVELVADDVTSLEPLDNCTKIYAWHVHTKVAGSNRLRNMTGVESKVIMPTL